MDKTATCARAGGQNRKGCAPLARRISEHRGYSTYEELPATLTASMALYTPLSLDDARRFASRFGRTIRAVEGIPAGSVNSNYRLQGEDGERLFLRIYEEQGVDGAHSEAALLRWLVRQGVPAVPPLQPLDGLPLPPLAHRPVALFPWIDGASCCQASVTATHARTIGAALARIHLAGSPTPRPGRFRVSDLLTRCDTIARAPDPSLAAMAPQLRAWLGDAERARSPLAHRGLCHGDLFRDNVLWRGHELAAILDFESASEEPLVFDLAVTLLAWCYGDELRADLASAMVQGYQSCRPLPPEDIDAFHAEATLAALRFTTTRITDYAMRAHLGATVFRDYRRFLARFHLLQRLGSRGWLQLVGLAP